MTLTSFEDYDSTDDCLRVISNLDNQLIRIKAQMDGYKHTIQIQSEELAKLRQQCKLYNRVLKSQSQLQGRMLRLLTRFLHHSITQGLIRQQKSRT